MSNESADHLAPGTILSLFLTVDKSSSATPAFSGHSFLSQKVKSSLLSYSLIYAEYHPPSSSRYRTPLSNDREKPSPSSKIPDRPWSLSLQIAAAGRRKAIARKERLDDYELLWEEFFYRAAEEAFDSEVAACSRLQDLQGESIPRHYASGTLC
jgi:hypothetical protein